MKEQNWEIRRKYKADIDSNNKESMLKFFIDHEDYTTFELCCKYGIPVSTINYWRRKVGLPSKKRNKIFSKRNIITKPIKILDPEIWDNGPWFEEMYNKREIGAYEISKIINRSTVIVYRRLNRFRIPIREHKEAVKPKSKFFDKQWLWNNYVRHHRTLVDISKEIGINPYTLCGWLSHFAIPVRDKSTYSVIKRRRERVKAYYEKHGTSFQKTKK